ncbi:chorismate mutase [Paenibacillus arenilitoris]|uniref:Chorismate mutase n=1 Tax=Paenibacillus arenilitoris TaxID=2772299 RepID=A0A927CIQ9_9BACL|nr:chorismate mutase [Paenibacillus arenilitoris]MBD2867442.1 chorismate mutase [Paenibacillus arenilitoris]
MESSRLDELRRDIDRLDTEIIALLAERFKLTEDVGLYKAANRLEPQDSLRESKQFEKIARLSNDVSLNPDYATAIYRCLMDIVISRHSELRRTYEERNRIGAS